MKNSKTTKKALFSSMVALLLCFTMLLGTTFAWFTDTASTGINTIQSGNLDIEVLYAYPSDVVDGAIPDSAWKVVKENTPVFDPNALWEPGYTEIVYFKFVNKGSLALQFQMHVDIFNETKGINKDGDEFYLSDYIEAYVCGAVDYQFELYETRDEALNPPYAPNEWHGSLKEVANMGVATPDNPDTWLSLDTWNWLEPEEEYYCTTVLFMPTTVGNVANHKTGTDAPKIDLGINFIATQYNWENEKDSYDNNYDKDATYPEIKRPVIIPADAVKVADSAALSAALATGGNVALTNDIDVTSDLTVSANTVLYGTSDNVLTFSNNSKLTVSNDTSFELYGVQMDGEGTYSFDVNGNIVYDEAARRTTPLLNSGAGSTLVLGQGTVIENVVSKGSAVVSANGTDANRTKVVLEGATIKNCAGESGTIINVGKAGDVVIGEDTVISGNASYNNNNHGIIRVYNAWDAANPSTVTMNGGEITGNYYSGNGMIGLYYGKFIMNGGEINNNSWFADNQKNNGWYPVIYVHSNSQLVVNGGEICNNTVKYGVINSLNSGVDAALTINGGKITGNIATNNENKEAFAVVINQAKNSLVVSPDADVSGTVWIYYDENGQYIGKYMSIEEYYDKGN